MKVFRKPFVALSTGLILLTISACETENSGSAGGNLEDAEIEGPLTINPEIPDDSDIVSKGPHGEQADSAHELELSEEEIQEIRDGEYTAAIAMHYAGNDWSQAQINGLEDTFEELGIEITNVTDAQFSVEKQMNDIETILANQPDILVSIPVDPISTVGAYQLALDAGVDLIFMDEVPEGFTPEEDYTSVVSADNFGNGVVAAHLMAEKLNEEGDIGVIYHDADFFVTAQRVEAFEQTIEEDYPNINIASRDGIGEPEDGESVASSMLTRDPNLDGMFVVWDVPAEGAIAAADSAGHDDLVMTTIDLGANVGLDMARDGNIQGVGAQLPYDQGVAEAILAGYEILDKEAPPYVAVPALDVTRENIDESWNLIYNENVPQDIEDEMD
ncbi:sugar ABC transporter substrate-binding protein [Salicibibacter halophilus]|uniref:Sugar ABC transporter substrate-binding protein n=1 Tax=Salicibibacter halophilus TaxID=2502791 RepID=A0A514LJ84_9BACI|nr:substrate-binding domain-containing protein [Salicibibacter halophilus]QDI91930.1 sugar ABC transporter substrate-binding protein [Salicibibacter halophilus]